MKRILIFSVILIFAYKAQAQNLNPEVEVGDVLTITGSADNNLKSFNLPKANFIIKKGGIADYKRLRGHRVEITAITTEEDGSHKLVLRREDGRKFFRSFPVITAKLEPALANRELSL